MSNIMPYKSIFLCIVLLCCATSGLAVRTKTIMVDTSQKSFTFSLPSNPTTGYQWSIVQYDNKLLTLGGTHFKAPKKELVGQGGDMVFTFKLNQIKSFPKKTQLLLQYKRPWEQWEGSKVCIRVNFVTH